MTRIAFAAGSERLLIPALLILTLLGCSARKSSPDPDPGIRVIGRWDMLQVLQNGQDVSGQHNPSRNRWIGLNQAGTFESGGDPYGRNTGRWTYDAATRELFLNSDAGEDDDSYWIVSFQGDTMTWRGSRFDFARQFTIRHVR